MIVKLIVIASAMCVLPLSSKIHSAGLERGDDLSEEAKAGALHTVQAAAPQSPPAIEAVRVGPSSIPLDTRPLPQSEEGDAGAARGSGASKEQPTLARAPSTRAASDMIPPTVNPAVQGALRTAFSAEAFEPNTLQRPIRAVVSLSYCMLGTAQITERVFRPLAYFGGAASLTAFTLAGTVDHVPFLESEFTHIGFWIAGITAGVSVVRMGAPKLVRDLQTWIGDVERQRQEAAERTQRTDGEIDPESGEELYPRGTRHMEIVAVGGAIAPRI